MHEIREVLRHCVGSELGQRPIAERAGVDRKTVRRYIEAALALGVLREGGLQLTNVHGKLERRGVVVPCRTLHRFAVERCGFGHTRSTVRVADGEPGMECQVPARVRSPKDYPADSGSARNPALCG
ncbi:MAG: hypothetical protein ACYC6M_16660 [Terriglobales bacterium]